MCPCAVEYRVSAEVPQRLVVSASGVDMIVLHESHICGRLPIGANGVGSVILNDRREVTREGFLVHAIW